VISIPDRLVRLLWAEARAFSLDQLEDVKVDADGAA
jgi:hypothetical protein